MMPGDRDSDAGLRSPRVAILMGTFNGERFLRPQLDSIGAQTMRDWVLWVSDDGSTDRTLSILYDYQRAWGENRLIIKRGPSKGFRANFLSLVCDPAIEAEYYAFADQDDLWDQNKLDTALHWIESVPGETAALYCGRTRLIDENDRCIGLSPLFPRPFVFENAIAQSGGGGNTMLFNAAARALLLEAGPDVEVQTHDWWAYIVVSGCGGRVHYDPKPTVGYRQHGRNLVGSNASWSGRLRRFYRILHGQFRRMNDRNIVALDRIRHRLSPRSRFVLDEFACARSRSLIPRVLGIRRAGIYCQTLISNLALTAAVLLKKV